MENIELGCGAHADSHYHRVMPQPNLTTLFEDAIDVPIWLEADRGRPLAERTQRDRSIGRAVSTNNKSARVRIWWRSIHRGSSDLPGRGLEHTRQWLNVVVALFGILGGAGLALAAYRYDGTYPVNVVRVLALLVAPQLILLALNVLLLPGRLPGLARLQDALAAVNPGALVASVHRQLTERAESAVFGWASAHSSAARCFAKWQMVFWSQIAAVGFNVAAIATAAALIAFTDLAFGWSTTLAIDAQAATRVFDYVAMPWAALVSSAVPDAALVEQSQFFRLDGGRDFAAVPASALTAWWSFTLAAIVVYGLVPRLVFLIIAAWRLRVATHAMLLEDARVTALLDRLSAPDIETRSAEHPGTRQSPPPTTRVGQPTLAGAADAVIWGHCIDVAGAAEFARARLGLDLRVTAEAGGGQSVNTDRVALSKLDGSNSVLVFTPAWEPPLLEFGDFLAALRKQIGASSSILVVPLSEHAESISALDLEAWTRAVNQSADPGVYLETGDP